MDNRDRGTTKFVTARELGRYTAELLDAVAEGTRLVVTRRGIPTAVIEATEQLRLLNKARPTPVADLFDEEVEEEAIDLASLKVPDDAFLVLDALERLGDNKDAIMKDTQLGTRALAMMGMLEIRLLSAPTMRGYVLTRLGERVLDAWRKGQ